MCDKLRSQSYYINNSNKVKAKQQVRDIKAYNRKYYLENIEKESERRKARYWNNPEAARESTRQWSKQNPEKVNCKGSKRRVISSKATPSWADVQVMESFYREAANISVETGLPHEVDHIVPLQSDIVCGLHNHFNLQVLTKTENCSKGNRFWPDMPD